jgi:hypothetical protein
VINVTCFLSWFEACMLTTTSASPALQQSAAAPSVDMFVCWLSCVCLQETQYARAVTQQ